MSGGGSELACLYCLCTLPLSTLLQLEITSLICFVLSWFGSGPWAPPPLPNYSHNYWGSFCSTDLHSDMHPSSPTDQIISKLYWWLAVSFLTYSLVHVLVSPQEGKGSPISKHLIARCTNNWGQLPLEV